MHCKQDARLGLVRKLPRIKLSISKEEEIGNNAKSNIDYVSKGVDDIFSFITSCQIPDIEVVAITVVCGNVPGRYRYAECAEMFGTL